MPPLECDPDGGAEGQPEADGDRPASARVVRVAPPVARDVDHGRSVERRGGHHIVPRSATAIRLWSEKKVGGRADDIDARRPYRRRMPSAFTRTDHHDRDAYLDRLRRARPLATASDGELRAMAQVAEYLRVDAGTPLAGASVHWR